MTARPRRGFTLIEVLVALTVIAIALSAVMRLLTQSIDTAAELRDRTRALWVAQNRLALHEMRQDWLNPDQSRGEAEMGGAHYFWREQVVTTPEPRIRRIEITVHAKADSDHALARLTGFLRQNDSTAKDSQGDAP